VTSVRRHLDVFFQHLVPFVAALVLVPLLLGACAFALDRSQLVTARIWADRPVFLPEVGQMNEALAGHPAESGAAVLRELIATDSFVSGVLAQVDSTFQAKTTDQRSAELAAVRRDVKITALGNHVLSVTYRTPRPALGVALVASLVESFGTTFESIESQQATGSSGAAAAGLTAARADLQAALAELQRYTNSLPDRDPAFLRQDPTYQTISADTSAKLDHYLSLLAVSQQAEVARSAIPSLQRSLLQLLDPPAARPEPLSLRTPAVRLFLIGLAAAVTTELGFVYVIGLRDPRIRSGDDVRRRTGLRFLGSTPALGGPLP
jgi:uncharacterized protein involved in exopolysaccharide biosynthesis